jgi:exonuclease SbcC
MIPLKLELTNFLSYREPVELDFHGIQLACISGINGAGKSSILDGLTWALFGKSRSKSNDDVVNRLAVANDRAAEVKFLFELEGVQYQVIRRKRAGRTMRLEFQVLAQDEKWKSLSESKLRLTQEAIERLLKMSFETFVNASFLLQGKADEFTTKTPNKRKEILADLLGVTEWDSYRDVAAVRRRAVEDQIMLLDGRASDIDQELAEGPQREAELGTARIARKNITEQLKLQETLLDEARRTDAAIDQAERSVRNLAKNLESAQEALADSQQTRIRRQHERDAFQQLLDKAETISADFAAFEKAEDGLRRWQEKANALNAIESEKRPYELTIEGERSRLQQRRSELEAQAERIAGMRRERRELHSRIDERTARLDSLSVEHAALKEQEGLLDEARATRQKLESERGLWSQEAGQLQKQAARIGQLRQERTAVESNLHDAQSSLEKVSSQLAALDEASERLNDANADLNQRKQEQPRLKSEMEQFDKQLRELREEVTGDCPLCGRELDEEHRESVIAELTSRGTQDGDRYRENKALIPQLAEEVADLSQKVAGKDQLRRDEVTQRERETVARLKLEEIDQAIAEWESEGAKRLSELETRLADESALDAAQRNVTELQKSVAEKERLEAERNESQQKITEDKARLREIDRAIADWDGIESDEGPREGPAKELTGLKAELAQIAGRLDAGKINPEAQTALAELEERSRSLGYDSSAHEAARQKREGLAEAQTRHQELLQAQAAVRPLDDTLADLDKQLAAQESTVSDLSEQHDAAAAQLEALSDGRIDLAAVERDVNRLREEEITAYRKVAAIEQSVNVLDDLRRQKEELAVDRIELTKQVQRLKLLVKAFSREGVQALLIERALPEIEDDANELLDRLTGGQMRLSFETQRKLKSSDRLAETLDISISDGSGERPYENFSGGEQFRVNFAIRLALSKILTRRAGARLQTLVIDEGFGSQDPDGRRRLIEAIHTIQDDFEIILVITHIDEVRDAFPNRIEVEKGQAGSKISIF